MEDNKNNKDDSVMDYDIDNLDLDLDNLDLVDVPEEEYFSLDNDFFAEIVDIAPPQNFRIVVELNNLERESKNITYKLINLHKSLLSSNHQLYADKIKESINFSWHIMKVAQGWKIYSEEEDWTEDTAEQQVGLYHLNEAINQLSQLSWWLKFIENDIQVYIEEGKSYYSDIVNLLNDSKFINDYFNRFRDNMKK